MKSIAVCLFLLISVYFSLLAQTNRQNNQYYYVVDLTTVVDDKVHVELITPRIGESSVVFYLPKIIPGTYSIANYGRFIADLKAFDHEGRELRVQKINENGWQISNAQRLTKVTYWVDDILDSDVEGPAIYPMAATNIEDGRNFVINTSGFFGYFEGMKDLPVEFDIIRPKNFYGSTGLIASKSDLQPAKVKKDWLKNQDGRLDRFLVENYDRLIDSPLMYCKPDTTIMKIANTEVLIASYSPTGKVTAKEIKNTVREVLNAQAAYLGGKLPVEKYAFIFYFTDQPVKSYGALEHWYSSFYYMPEGTIDEMKQQLRDFAAHEFFHIVTPLNIHSKQIHEFEFNEPEMSKHLWMYEGVTEYFAGNVQVKYGLLSKKDYLNVIRSKMLIADQFIDNVPFTEISKFSLDKYANQYYNVYQKGALIAMCLDIKLRSLSKGKYGLQNLMNDLAERYGKDQPFDDDELFNVIEQLTFPEIGEFLRLHVGGSEPLPFSEIFQLVGLTYEAEKHTTEVNIGFTPSALRLTEVDGDNKLMIGDLSGLTKQGELIGFKEGDVMLEINGKEIPTPGPGIFDFFNSTASSLYQGGRLSYRVLRKDGTGKLQPLDLTATVIMVEASERHTIGMDEKASPDKLAIQHAWLSAE